MAKILLGSIEPSFLGHPRFYLSPADQNFHATIWGATGSGKSFLLLSLFLQHFRAGNAVGLIDPHNDLSIDVLSQLVASGAFKDQTTYRRLVYIDWGNRLVTPFNILSGAQEQSSDPDLLQFGASAAAAKVLDMAYRVWPELRTGAPSFKQHFASAIMILIANGLPLGNLLKVLTDASFRDACLKRVADLRIQTIWSTIANLRSENDKEALLGSSRRRADDLIADPITYYAFNHPDNVIKHREWMDNGTCFIHNLGKIPSRLTRQILGALLLVDIEQAAMSRVELTREQRPPLTLLVDEWAMFAAQEDTISHILSETRKYGLRLYLAAQSLAQVGTNRLSGALENCRLNIAMSLGHDSAKRQAEHIATIDPGAIKEEAPTDSAHNLFTSYFEQTQGWTDELKGLPQRMAYAKLHHKPATLIKTPYVPVPNVDQADLDNVLLTYRGMYQQTVPEAVARISQVPQPETQPAYRRLFDK